VAGLFLMLGSVLALLGVGLGAFGAHALRKKMDERSLANYQTAVQYQMYHAGGLMLTAFAIRWMGPSLWLQWAGWLFLGGIILFSGSLYILSITGVKRWGIVTPLGGLAFIAAWGALALQSGRMIH
jgi:uncharacterized membrane protein YgdD (TMEM256/DUF423 family)